MLTGRRGPRQWRQHRGRVTPASVPSPASSAARTRRAMPAYVAVPYAMSIGLRPGYFGGQLLGVPANPFETTATPASRTSRSATSPCRRPDGRETGRPSRPARSLRHRPAATSTAPAPSTPWTASSARPWNWSPARPPGGRSTCRRGPAPARPLRPEQLGPIDPTGRRLVEAGVTFTTVHLGGWDHQLGPQKGMENYLPKVDALGGGRCRRTWPTAGCWSGRWWCLCGEFSRTPENERRLRPGHPGPRPLGQLDVLPARRRRGAGRPGRRQHRPPGHHPEGPGR